MSIMFLGFGKKSAKQMRIKRNFGQKVCLK